MPVVSADGNFVAFASYDDNLVPNEADGPGLAGQGLALYLYNVPTGQVSLVNHVPGSPALIDLEGASPAISADGSYVAFLLGFTDYSQSSAQSGQGAVVLYNRAADTMTFITPLQGPDGLGSEPTISDDGRFVAYQEFFSSVYVFDRSSGTSTLVSHSAGSGTIPANGTSSDPVISHDGSTIAFISNALNLVNISFGSNSFTNVYLYKNDGSGALRLISGAGGDPPITGNGNSDSPVIDGDGSYVAYRSDATDLLSGQVSGSNVYEYNTQAATLALVSHEAGSLTIASGGASEPVIDDDGHLISYVSTAGNLIPGQSGTAGIKNVFVWLRQTGANILASGQDGSPTLTGDADFDGPLLTRDSFPGFSSKAKLLRGVLGDTSVAYINTLVAVSLSPNVIADGSHPGSLVGYLTVSSLLAGQYLPPKYSVPGADADLFTVGATVGGSASLLTQFLASYAAQSSYQVGLLVDVGFGFDPVALQVRVVAPNGPPPAPPPGARGDVTARLVAVKVRKKTRLMVVVFDAATGVVEGGFLLPFQAPTFRNIRVGLGNGNQVVVTARRGRRTVSQTFPG